MSRRPKDESRDREYPTTLYRADEGGFVAEHRDLPGCLTQGDTLEDAVESLNVARRLWIATALEHGDEIPLPSTDERFAGRVLVRMPRSLHRRLFERADSERVSLNQHIVALLAAAAGMGGAAAALSDRYSTAGTHSARVSERKARRR
jgi:predicted RNase H-like HicB family nuclease